MNVLLGYRPYQGSLQVNGIELRDIALPDWQRQLAWVGQNPHLPASTLRITSCSAVITMRPAWNKCWNFPGSMSFCRGRLPNWTVKSANRPPACRLVRPSALPWPWPLMKPCQLLLLDEPDASLDAQSEQHVNHALLAASHHQSTLLITHQLDSLTQWDEIWLMRNGNIVAGT